LLAMPERGRFLRGMVSWIGFRQVPLPYEREVRHAGRTKYSLLRMVRFAMDGILSFSLLPLRLASFTGMVAIWLAIGGIIVVVLLLSWLNERSLSDEPSAPAEVASTETAPQAPAPSAQAPQTQPAQANGPVTLTATQEAWVQVKDGGKTLFEGVMAPGQTYQVPPTATAPLLKAGKPEALRITVGSSVAPPVGPAGRVAANVSLAPADLMRGGNGGADATAPVAAPSAPQGVQNSVE